MTRLLTALLLCAGCPKKGRTTNTLEPGGFVFDLETDLILGDGKSILAALQSRREALDA